MEFERKFLVTGNKDEAGVERLTIRGGQMIAESLQRQLRCVNDSRYFVVLFKDI